MRRTLLLAPLLIFGCGDSSPANSDGAPAQQDLALADLASSGGGGDLLSSMYPAGPYGNTVGAIIPPLVWEGYSDPLADAIATSKTYGWAGVETDVRVAMSLVLRVA